MSPEERQELATLYVNGRISPELKLTVFGLILEDASFREMLREEIEWVRRMQSCRALIDPEWKAASLAKIQAQLASDKTDGRDAIAAKASEITLRLLLPGWVFPYVRPAI